MSGNLETESSVSMVLGVSGFMKHCATKWVCIPQPPIHDDLSVVAPS